MSRLQPEALGGVVSGGQEKRTRVLLKYATALLGQGLLSLFHFGLNIALVRTFVPHDYGVFALAFVAGVMGSSVVNAMVGTPVSVYTPGLMRRAPRVFLETLLSTINVALVGGILLITVLVTVSMHFSAATVLSFSGFVALYSARQYSRNLAFARHLPQVALYADAAYVLSALLVIGLAGSMGVEVTLVLVLAALATGNIAAIAIEFRLLADGRFRIVSRRGSLRRYADIWVQSRWALVGAITTLIASQAHSFLVSLFSGPAAYAPLAAGFVLFGPIRIGLQSWLSVMRPEMAVAIGRHDARALGRIQRNSIMAMLLGMGLFSVLLVLFQEPIFSFLYANKYADQPMGWIVAGWCLVTYFTALSVTPSGMLQSLKAFRLLAMATVYSAVLSVVLVGVLLFVSGPAYTVLGVLGAEMFLAIYAFRAVLRRLEEGI